MSQRSGEYPCRACDTNLADDAIGNLWVRSEFGLTTLKVCKTQDCARRALALTGYKLLPGNQPPKTREQKDSEAFEAGRRAA